MNTDDDVSRSVRSLRVALAGASGTGKTTLARYVSERYGLPINPVGSRSVSAAMGFASPYDVDAAGKRGEFQRRLQEEKIAWEMAHRRRSRIARPQSRGVVPRAGGYW